MVRKGYASEYKAKKKLISEFGKNSVFKLAIGQAADYIVVNKGRAVKIVEVKECHQNVYRASKRDMEQFERVIDIALSNDCIAERWVYFPKLGVKSTPSKEKVFKSHLPNLDEKDR